MRERARRTLHGDVQLVIHQYNLIGPLDLDTHLRDSISKLLRRSLEDRVVRSKLRLQCLDAIEHRPYLRAVGLFEIFNIAVQVLQYLTGFDIDIFGSLQFLAELGEKCSDIFHGHQIKLSML